MLIRLPLSLATAKKRHVREVREQVDPIIYHHIRTRREHGDGTCLLDALIAATDADMGERMSDEQLRDEVATLFAAGHETTAYALTWACVLLAHFPNVQTRLQAEVDGCQGDGLELHRLPYLNAVWQETLRLYPTIPAAPRVCLQDTTLQTDTGNVTIEKGQRVIVSISQIHRNPAHWPEPEAFLPERFLQDTPRHKLAFMPFGAGERFCVGRDLAQLQGRLVLALTARQVDFGWLEHLPDTRVAISLLPRESVLLPVSTRHTT
jgi:cytochrome P450